MAHSLEWYREREKGIGGSDARRIMSGDWLSLWEEKTGRKPLEDLSDVLPVQIGIVTEDLNRHWFARQMDTAVSVECCAHIVHSVHHFMRANLDGLCSDGALLECKHVSAFTKDEAVVERYYPQLQHCLVVAERDRAHLSVFFGNHRWAAFAVDADIEYQRRLIEREAEFWRHVEMDIPPEAQDAVLAEIAFDDMRVVDMTGHNLWASQADRWLHNREAAKEFKTADRALKDLVERDVKSADGHGVKVTRAKNGALTVRPSP